MTNHGWRSVRGKNRGRGGHGDQQRASGIRHGLGVVVSWALTLLAVMVSWVFFRALSFEGAMAVLRGMFGFNGLSLPQEWAASLQGLTAGTKGWVGFEGIQVNALPMGTTAFLSAIAAAAVAFCCPNVSQIMHRWKPAFETYPGKLKRLGSRWLHWEPNRRWAMAVALLAFLSVTNLTSVSEFLFFQF